MSLTTGTAYYPDYYPEKEWERDLESMKRNGIRVVRILEFAWSWYQPSENCWILEPLDRFLALCQKLKLEVMLSTPTATPPPWFFEKYPDARLVNRNGVPCFSHRHMTCWNHPAAREEAWRTIRKIVERYGEHPAVIGWQIDNEPNYAEQFNEYYDFNPYFLADGRLWLKEKYGTLDKLNEAWFTAFWSQKYDSWEQVWKTHMPVSGVNPQCRLDFMRWRDASMARFVTEQASLLRKHAPHQLIGTNIPETGIRNAAVLGQDYWGQAQGLDWVGTDLYCGTSRRDLDMAAFAFSTDIMYSVALDAKEGGAAFYITETQASPHIRAWGSKFAPHAWSPDYQTEVTRTYRQRGADQVWYFTWRPAHAGREMGMFGVTDLNGKDTEYTEEIARINAAPDQFEADRKAYFSRPIALMHYSRSTMLFLEDMEDMLDYERSMRGAHRLLDEAGYQIRFITDEQLSEGRIPEGELLVLAESALLSKAQQESVLAWFAERDERRLTLGMDSAMLNEIGHLVAPEDSVLWSWLKIRPSWLYDVDISAELDKSGVHVSAFRRLIIEESAVAEVTSTLHWEGHEWPAKLSLQGGRVSVYGYRWGALLESLGSDAIAG